MNTKAFTLIELLAVIVILSIILLIAVPIVLRVIKDSKKSTAKDSLELYGRAVEQGVANYFLKNLEEDEVTMDELKEGEYIQYKGTVVECEEVQIYERNVYLASCTVGDTNIDDTYGTHIVETKVQQKKNYIGYYADVDGDGNVDGVIYADLAHSKEETTWGRRYHYDYGEYSYEVLDDLKKYTISENKHNDNFGEKEIITLKSGSTGNKRFYVMALNDFTTGSMTGNNAGEYYWYRNAAWKMNTWETDTSDNFGTGYKNTGEIIEIWNAGENGKYNAAQDNYDIWGHIQEEYVKGWYMPSIGEWAAFADYLAHRQENPLTSNYNSNANDYSNNGNYDDVYGLKAVYWSSSQLNEDHAWRVSFIEGGIEFSIVYGKIWARLGYTF